MFTVMETKISRRDMTLMGAGIAVLLVGKFADSAVNGFAAEDSNALNAAVQHVASVPESIGNWTSTSSTLSEREIEVAGIEGYIRREYRNAKTGYRINLTLLCGHSGPMSVHPPTACFEGVGYTLISGPTITTVKHDTALPGQMNKSSFRQGNASVPEIVRVFWGWGADGGWSAPANPRFSFRGQPFLYKLYVTDSWLEDTGRTPLPQIESFLEDAMPVICAALGG